MIRLVVLCAVLRGGLVASSGLDEMQAGRFAKLAPGVGAGTEPEDNLEGVSEPALKLIVALIHCLPPRLKMLTDLGVSL